MSDNYDFLLAKINSKASSNANIRNTDDKIFLIYHGVGYEVLYRKYSFVDLKKDFIEEFWVILILMIKIQTILCSSKGRNNSW